ncbi:MAG: hypothetical protein U1E27_03410, partial [Kiritimatiellia bacterium]|nr:hypothetical protein [Kiritimatiellia bacterium]
MKSNGWTKILLGVALAAFSTQAFATNHFWDVNGSTTGFGDYPRTGVWDNTATNWTVVSGGNANTFAWHNNIWPTAPDGAVWRVGTTTGGSQAPAGTYTLLNPSHVVSIVGTQRVANLHATHGAFVILTNGAVALSSASTPISVGVTTANNTLLIFSDIQLAPQSATPAATQAFTFEAGREYGTASESNSVNNSLIIAGKVYAVMTNATTISLQPGKSGTGLVSKVVLLAGSEIHNGLATAFNVNVGRGQGDATVAGRIEFRGTNSYTGTTSFYGGTAVTYVDALVSQAGAFGNSSEALWMANGDNTTATNKVELLIGAAGVTVARDINIQRGAASNTVYGAYLGGEHTTGTSTFSGTILLATGGTPRTTDVHLVSAAGGTVRFTGNIQDGTGGGAPINKLGLGTVELAGANNNYRGGTKVTEGTLLVTGMLSGTNTVTVAAGATLGGTGVITGHTTVDGTLSPGTSVGELTFEGNLTLGGGSTSAFEINGLLAGQYDQVLLSVSGKHLTYGGTLELDIWSGAQVGDF